MDLKTLKGTSAKLLSATYGMGLDGFLLTTSLIVMAMSRKNLSNCSFQSVPCLPI